MLKMAVLASGSGSNLQSIIDQVASGNLPIEIVVVISNNPEAYALERAKQVGIKTQVILPKAFATREEYDAELVKTIKEHHGDTVALAGYMRIVTPVFLQGFPGRVLNIHPALLPCFPGLHGQQQAFDYGVKFSGCTVHFVDHGTDTGPIIAQAIVPVLQEDTADSLAARILVEEHKLYPYCLKLLAEDKLEVCGRKVRILE